MKGLAKRLAPGEEEFWGIVGLLHDLDEEHCDWKNNPAVHGPTSVEILKKEGIEEPVLFDAIKAHNPKCGMKAKTKLQYAVLAADPMSGFVKAVAQIYPDKKIASVKDVKVDLKKKIVLIKSLYELEFNEVANLLKQAGYDSSLLS
jgi:predicted hydrolase (HD superfamily)